MRSVWLCEFTKYNSTKNFKAQPQIFFFFYIEFYFCRIHKEQTEKNGRKRSNTCGCLVPQMRRPMLFCEMLDTYYRVLTLILDGNFQYCLSILSCKANIYKYITWQACNIIHVPSVELTIFSLEIMCGHWGCNHFEFINFSIKSCAWILGLWKVLGY